ncbi:MAG: hypothetical protein N0C91_10180 [Candidatus Thiodiazotropha endolucinida]|nr:hypothetical protein [Candidatus Thiodiazotropha taylori]MCG8119140.1 hypothetical protein [Candidatus Thiodiazotropha taylori]MCW4288070.1 hypothetical protein [Candidatus Thiodiazotropha endolucinida]MCW4294826.1 hypothetical protein [Candidatus Thiodiazotropha endolucinida]
MAQKILSDMTETELLQLQASVINELKARGVVRTKNNSLGDYTEWLVAKSIGLELANNSAAGYDATDSDGIRYQIKGRRVTPENPSRQLGAILNLDEKDFDFLAAVVFDEHYSILDAVIVPHELVGEYGSYRKHVNAHVLHLRGAILDDVRVKDFREQIVV